jgi:YegS/Rv2252/BmrU family lipid kinase
VTSCIDDQVFWDLAFTENAGHATQLAENGIRAGFDAIVAVGGDGTLNEVGRALVGQSVPMGVIPAGSGNAFARALGISLSKREAFGQLLGGQIRSLDVGRVGDETFLSTAGIGLDAEVCKRFSDDPGGRGVLPYLKHTAVCVWAYQASPMKMYLDEDHAGIEVCPTLLTIANTPAFGYGATVAPGASAEDGFLDIVVVEGLTVVRAVMNAHRLYNGTFHRTTGVSRYLARRARVERSGIGPIQVDGESAEAEAILDITVVASGLKVISP